MLSDGSATPANGCDANDYGDSEDFLVVADVVERITIADVSVAEDGGPITVTATLSHSVRDSGGFVSFTVDYITDDGSATIANNDYTSATGALTFNGQAGDTATFTITPTVDIVPEGDETIQISLQNLSNTTHGIDISDTATITLQEDDTEVSLVMIKLADDYSPNIGATVVFDLQVNNSGPDSAVNAIVQDLVPGGLDSITPVSVPAGTVFSISGNTIDWTGLNVPSGTTLTATYSAKVLPP